MKRFIVLLAFALALVACDEAAGGYTYTPAYEPPTLRPPQAATVAESYVILQVTQQAAEAQLASNNADFSATSTAVAGDIAILKFDATRTAAAEATDHEGTQWAATMTQDATNAAGALQATNAEATRVQSAIQLQATRDWAAAEAARLDVKRQEMTNTYNAWAGRLFLGALGIVILLAGVFAAYWLRLYSLRVRDALGQPMWYDGKQLTRAYSDETTIALSLPARDVQVAKQINGQVIVRNAPALPAPSQPVLETEQALLDAPDVPLPDWQEFVTWPGWNTRRLLLGHSLDDALAIDPEHDPHVMIAGTSGSGKTRHGLTILGAAALRLGWHVVILNRAGSDFAPLTSHPAAHIFDGAQFPLAVLAAAAAEVDRRNEMLRAAGATTWSRMGNPEPRVLVMVDELVALTQSAAEQEQATAIWRAVVHVTSAGRKCGVHLAFATTDPTHKTLGRLGLVTRDNCARVAFRLRGNQAIVPGGMALDLEARRFLALTSAGNAPQPGAAFAPEDDELETFVKSLVPTRPVELPAFLGQQNLLAQPIVEQKNETLERVRLALQANPKLSKRKLCLQVLGQSYAGSFAEQLDRALAADGGQLRDGEWRRASATTTASRALTPAAAKG